MKPKEAIDWCEQFINNLVSANVDTKKRTLGLKAMQTCKSALEKQTPKKPTPQVVKGGKRLIGNGWWCKGTTVYKCPCCNSWITQTYKYCIDCGQALDWSDTNDRT